MAVEIGDSVDGVYLGPGKHVRYICETGEGEAGVWNVGEGDYAVVEAVW